MAKVIFVNNDLNECKRAKKQFGRRLNIVNMKALVFILFEKFKFKPKKLEKYISNKYLSVNFAKNNGKS